MLENTKSKSRCNLKKCSSNPQGVKKNRGKKKRRSRKQNKKNGRFRCQLINKQFKCKQSNLIKKRDCQIR